MGFYNVSTRCTGANKRISSLCIYILFVFVVPLPPYYLYVIYTLCGYCILPIDNRIRYLYNVCMNKPISVTLPEELLKQTDTFAAEKFMDRSELIKNALVSYMIGVPRPEERDEASEKPVDEVPVLELPPFCEANKNCRSRSTGQFRIITNDGTEEKVLYLCPTHLGLAKREGEVKELAL